MAKSKKISSTVGKVLRSTTGKVFKLKKGNNFTTGKVLLPKNGAFSVLGCLPTVLRYYNIPCIWGWAGSLKRVQEWRVLFLDAKLTNIYTQEINNE